MAVKLSTIFKIILSDGWNGEYTEKGKKLTIHSKDYNGAVEAGESASEIGFIVSASKAPLLAPLLQ